MSKLFWTLLYTSSKLNVNSLYLSVETMDIGTTESLRYNFSLVKAATDDFSEDNKLGQGGFGAVYKVYIHSFFG